MKLFIWSLLWPEPLESFLSLAHCFENNDDKQTTVIDLVELMQDHLTSIDSNKKTYGVQYMKQILQDHFKDKIIFTDIAGKNVITFRTTASSILHDYYIHDKNACEDIEALRLIEAAAKLIKSNIKAVEESEDYPNLQQYINRNVFPTWELNNFNCGYK